MAVIQTVAELEQIYSDAEAVAEAAIAEVSDHIIPYSQRFIEAAPFLPLAMSGLEGLDCSPRGDLPGFVRVESPRTLLLPDRRGNSRIDHLRNVTCDHAWGLCSSYPASATPCGRTAGPPSQMTRRCSCPSR